ncbi:hypothetical protein BD779DRAFT_1674495 [Infundibulicybe gibba]|nr:hypothetical protein BD779DRAFT_1674495 [Infundibulicybe gibba]
MSAVNLVGGLLMPMYPTLYLVSSSIMDEAKSRPGAVFVGVIGRIEEVGPDSSTGADLASSAGVKEVDPPPLTERAVPTSFTGIEEVNPASPTGIEEVDRIEGDFMAQTIGDQSSNQKPLLFRTHGSPNHSDQKHYKVIEAEEPHKHLILDIPCCPRFYRRSPTTGERQLPQKIFEGDAHTPAQYICLAFGSISIAIVGALSHFHSGQSTKAQRVWIMMWLVFGVLLGTIMAIGDKNDVDSLRIIRTPKAGTIADKATNDGGARTTTRFGPVNFLKSLIAARKAANATTQATFQRQNTAKATLQAIFQRQKTVKATLQRQKTDEASLPSSFQLPFAFFYGVPAVGGLIVVGKMLFEYGSCTELG